MPAVMCEAAVAVIAARCERRPRPRPQSASLLWCRSRREPPWLTCSLNKYACRASQRGLVDRARLDLASGRASRAVDRVPVPAYIVETGQQRILIDTGNVRGVGYRLFEIRRRGRQLRRPRRRERALHSPLALSAPSGECYASCAPRRPHAEGAGRPRERPRDLPIADRDGPARHQLVNREALPARPRRDHRRASGRG
jgi:hypothetical protein